MSIFNEEQIKAMFSREYICHECGHLMEFEDEWEDTLVCPHCGHSIDLDDYGREGNEEYENLYPTREAVPLSKARHLFVDVRRTLYL